MPDSSAIDSLRDASGRLDRAAVRQILPYGDDFLFVDEVSVLTQTEVTAHFTVPTDSPYIRSHFEGLELMPGVLIGEGMAQAGTLMIRFNLDDHVSKDILAYQIETALFSAPVLPGDRLRFEVRLLNLRRRAARLEGEAFVGDRRACKARLVLAIIERHTLRDQLDKTPGT